MMRFLKDIRPRWIVSFHQPLNGVDTDTKDRRFTPPVPRVEPAAGSRSTAAGLPRHDDRLVSTAASTAPRSAAEYGARPATAG